MLRRMCILFICFLAFFVYSGERYSYAAGSIRVIAKDVLPGSDKDLGLVIIEAPPGVLQSGDSLIMALPAGFSYNTGLAVSVGGDVNNLVQSTVNVVYPPDVSGDTNAIAGNITADYVGPEWLRVSLTGAPALTNKAYLYVFLKGVTVPAGFAGDVDLTFTSNSGWPNVVNTGKKAEQGKKPPEEPGKQSGGQTGFQTAIEASFIIGQKWFSVNNSVITMDVAPFIKNNRTYVPVRYVARTAGIPDDKITYESGKVTIKAGDYSVRLIPGSRIIEVDGKKIEADVPVLELDGRIFLPLRWVCEALDLDVIWQDANNTVIIKSKKRGAGMPATFR